MSARKKQRADRDLDASGLRGPVAAFGEMDWPAEPSPDPIAAASPCACGGFWQDPPLPTVFVHADGCPERRAARREAILAAITAAPAGLPTVAARSLGISPRTIWREIDRLGLRDELARLAEERGWLRERMRRAGRAPRPGRRKAALERGAAR